MKIQRRVMLMLVLVAGMACGGEVAQSFREPPELTKPWCYWYWIDADVTREGIARDLEHMARVGIRKALIGNVNVGSKPASKKNHQVWSAEWRALTRHAMKEAARVGVEIYMFNSPGWSQAGGPWIKPEQSMRRVSWSEYQAKGGEFSAQVRPAHIPASQDIAVLAVPRHGVVSVRGISEPAEPLVFKQSAPFTARSLVVDGPAVNATLFAVRDGNPELGISRKLNAMK